MKIDFAEVKPSILNWAIVGLMAVLFIAFAKFVLNKYPVSGLTDLINSV